MPRKRKGRTDEDFQMAPMIDMVFLLLVFFMTVSTLAKDARPELDLAVSTTAAIPEEAPPRDIVTIREAEIGVQYFWHNRSVTAEELSQQMEDSAGGVEGPLLLLRAGPGLPWSELEAVLQLCRKAGVREITLATFEA